MKMSTLFTLSIPTVLLLLVTTNGYGQATCAQSDVQSAINSATDGSTVKIPAGTCTWSSGVSWANKNITLAGAGQGVTNIILGTGADPGIQVTADTKSSFRITGMTISFGFISNASIKLLNSTSTVNSGWRIDHVTMNQTGGGSGNAAHPVYIIGLLWGLVDHCIFNDGGNGQQAISNYAYVNNVETSANVGRISWENVPVGLGTDSAVYVEDSVFNHSTTGMSAVNDTQYGGRMVIRHNTINNSMVMTHSAWGPVRGGLKLEVYNNTFTSTVGNYRPALIRSGTGVIFNNTINGNYVVQEFDIDNERSCLPDPTLCDGNDTTYDTNTPGQQGWACEDQIGRSGGAWKKQPSDPWYAWNNGSYKLVPNGGCSSPQVQSGRDYFNNGTTPKAGYTPYTYPHPLQGTGGASPNPPTALTGVPH
jgi:hypothetical protein